MTDTFEDYQPAANGAASYEDLDEEPERRCAICGRADFKSDQGLKRHITVAHIQGADDSGEGGDDSDDDATEDVGRPAERPPAPPKASGGLVGRFRGRWRQGKSASGPTAATKAKAKPRAKGPRISTADDFQLVFRDLGKRLEFSPHYPTGRMMQIQAPGAGVILDNAIAGTTLDRMVVQPLWRGKDRWEDPFYLLMPPFLTYSVQAAAIQQYNLAQAGQLEEAKALQGRINAGQELLAWVLRRSMVRLAPAIAEARKREEEENESIRQAFPELAELHPEADPVRALLSDLFAPPAWMTGTPPPSQEETENAGYADQPPA